MIELGGVLVGAVDEDVVAEIGGIAQVAGGAGGQGKVAGQAGSDGIDAGCGNGGIGERSAGDDAGGGVEPRGEWIKNRIDAPGAIEAAREITRALKSGGSCQFAGNA